MDPFTPGPYERIGVVVSDLTRLREILYGESEEELISRAQETSISPYPFAYGALRGRLNSAKLIIDRLWGDLVGIERALMPEEVER